MAAIETPHPQWPFRLNAAGTGLVFLEQDEDPEVEQCVQFVLTTEPGTLVGNPKMGFVDPTFKEGGARESDILAVVAKWEPRAPITFTDDEIVGKAQTVGIEVS
jgi:hypothetical protein